MSAELSAREVYQVLKDIALGVRQIQCRAQQPGMVQVSVDGWQLTLHNEGNELDQCSACTAADGRQASSRNWQRYGTDPVQLLSCWEREQIQRLLRDL